jgi:hypothetical protein
MSTFGYVHTDEVHVEGYTYVKRGDQYFRGCTRCGGAGHYSFNGYDSICYKCNNDSSAKLGVKVGDAAAAEADAIQRTKAAAARERKREKERLLKIQKREAAQAALKENYPDVFEFLMTDGKQYDHNNFLAEMASFVQYDIGITSKPFSAAMASAVRKIIAAAEAKKAEAEAHPVPTDGRQTISGTILSTKLVEGDYGTSYKVVVQDDRGFRVYVALPAAQRVEAIDQFESHPDWTPYAFGSAVWFVGVDGDERFPGVKGRRIQFDCKIEASGDDKSFGFGSRPTKGKWLA